MWFYITSRRRVSGPHTCQLFAHFISNIQTSVNISFNENKHIHVQQSLKVQHLFALYRRQWIRCYRFLFFMTTIYDMLTSTVYDIFTSTVFDMDPYRMYCHFRFSQNALSYQRNKINTTLVTTWYIYTSSSKRSCTASRDTAI